MLKLSKILKDTRGARSETLKDVSNKTGLSVYCIHRIENEKNMTGNNPFHEKALMDHYGIDQSSIDNSVASDASSKNATLKKLLVTANNIRNRFSRPSADNTDTATALCFPSSITYEDYRYRYKRQDIANRVVSGPVNATWKDRPSVSESAEKETAFESSYEDIVKSIELYSQFRKVDLLASLGKFAVLFIGMDGSSEDLSVPPVNPKKITYLSAVPENRATISMWEENTKSPRFGMPLVYQLQFNVGNASTSTVMVHWTRVLHVAENTLESEIYGIPTLEPIYNRLIGLEKLCGGSPEMYWKGARPGYTAQAQQDSVVSQEQLDSVKDELSSFFNDMQRFLYVEGIDIKALAPQVVSPKEHVEVQISMISAATGIPMRMLTGSERGELASSQDERAWLKLVEERRGTVARDTIIIPFITRCILLGLLPEPTEEYTVVWEPLVVLEEKDKAEIGRIRAEALSKYVSTPGADLIIPPEMFMKRELSFTDEEIELANEMVSRDISQEMGLDEEQDIEDTNL